ncbi:bacteriocin biosynthesis cyclodehydratase domain-containing protein [Lentzea xinjiangensis]|uniref:Bacteriocin biosynthesis cyclodehydratase domain-containing protein n=1 Tax=Lentzea xinjiangensis TaxID=402600 RepID=A0A1H9GUR2_9PSEU|nr:TOMM precursor leader peptide-binding protein [Lentzea xinjiangensis]SEQ53866.1 bacteriocin biosynthesis cyclodehydratase domain-containing protein [Lentzea xinjiangensis]
MSLVADPAWRAQVRDEGLVVYAGADLAYLVPDLPGAVAAALADLFEPESRGPARTVDENRLAEPVRRHLAQLRTLGALRPAGLPVDDVTPARAGTRVVGEAPAGLVERLPHDDDPELLLVVRTTGTLTDLVEVARETEVPHLLLDLAYHHTAAIGPFVVPGSGACLACLAVRTGRRWGDPPPPPRPAALTRDFPISLALQALQNIRTGSLALLDAVVTVDLDEFTTTRESVLPAAGCEVCPKAEFGRVPLPWGDHESDGSPVT